MQYSCICSACRAQVLNEFFEDAFCQFITRLLSFSVNNDIKIIISLFKIVRVENV